MLNQLQFVAFLCNCLSHFPVFRILLVVRVHVATIVNHVVRVGFLCDMISFSNRNFTLFIYDLMHLQPLILAVSDALEGFDSKHEYNKSGKHGKWIVFNVRYKLKIVHQNVVTFR